MPPTDLMPLDDDALVARARDGDQQAFGELVRRHQAAALRVAAVVCGSTEEAKDIVQDAFVAAHRHLGSYRATGPVRAWLLRIVANHARNAIRSRVRRLRRDERVGGLALLDRAGPDEAVIASSEHAAVATALGGLRPDDRAVLGCRFVAGLSEQETAQVLGLPLGTVKSRTSRALHRLRERIDVVDGGVAS